MNLVGRAALAIAFGAAGVVLFMVLTAVSLGAAPPWVDDALNEIGLGSDEFGAIALFLLVGTSGSLVGMVAGWFIPDVKHLRWAYARLLVATVALSIPLLTGLVFIGDLTNADGTDLRGYAGFACLPLALIGYFFLLRTAWRRVRVGG
jgi:hypothetical protein